MIIFPVLISVKTSHRLFSSSAIPSLVSQDLNESESIGFFDLKRGINIIMALLVILLLLRIFFEILYNACFEKDQEKVVERG